VQEVSGIAAEFRETQVLHVVVRVRDDEVDDAVVDATQFAIRLAERGGVFGDEVGDFGGVTFPKHSAAAIGKFAVPESLSFANLESVGEFERLIRELSLPDEHLDILKLSRSKPALAEVHNIHILMLAN
jgi:hypothetical protein